MSKELIINPGGVEFCLDMSRQGVEIFYQDKEISTYLRNCIVPKKDESPKDVLARSLRTRLNWEKMSKDEKYIEVPEEMSKEFEEKYGVDISKRVLIRNQPEKNKKELKSLVAGGRSTKIEDVGVVYFLSDRDMKRCFVHEALHSAYWDNPFLNSFDELKVEVSKKINNMPLPLVYSKFDKLHVYEELIVEAICNTNPLSFAWPCLPNRTSVGFLLASAVADTLSTEPFFTFLPCYLLGVYAVRIPRTIRMGFRARKYRNQISKLEDKLSTKNTVKLLQVSGPDELEKLVSLTRDL